MSTTASTALSRFATSGDEAAFRRVVDELGGLVLNTARRRTGDRELAKEVAQNVFAIMARKARSVAGHPSLTGWVFTTTRLEAAKALRGRHRHRRKLEALAEELETARDMNDDQSGIWRDALPHLEAGLDRLGDSERELLLARFFDQRSFKQIAAETGKTEAACKMRVRRALARLHTSLTRRGVTLSTTAVATGLTATWTQPASAAATATLAKTALTATSGVNTLTLLTNSLHTMNATKATALGAALALAVGAALLGVQQTKAANLKREITQMRLEVDARPPALAHARSKLTPARRFQQLASLPKDPAQVADAVMVALMEQDMGALLRATLAFSRMNPEEIENLLMRIRESGAPPNAKLDAYRLLVRFLDPHETNPGLVLDKCREYGVNATHYEMIVRWGRRDPVAALDWFSQRRADGTFPPMSPSESTINYYLAAILRGSTDQDPAFVMAWLGEFEAHDDRDKFLGPIAGRLLSRGQSGDLERARKILMTTHRSNRHSAFARATGNPMPTVSLDDHLTFGRSLDLDSAKGLAYQIALRRSDVPAVERGNWLLQQIDEGDSESLLGFVMMNRRGNPELGTWVDGLPVGPVQDAALRGEVETLRNGSHDGPAAIARARMISDSEARARVLVAILRQYPDAAQAAPPANEQEASELAAAIAQSKLPRKKP